MILQIKQWIAVLLVLALSGFTAPTWAQFPQHPLFVFASRDDAALAVVSRYLRRGDFVNINAAKKVPDLQERIGPDRLFRLSTNLEDIEEWSRKPCRDSGSAGLIIYDIEEWENTPAAEKRDPIRAMRRGADIVKGSGCRYFGLAPGRAYLTGHTRTCFSGIGQLPRGVNWRDMSVFVIQSQGMLRDRCVKGDPDMKEFAKLVADMTRMAKQANPSILVFAEVSFNRSPTETIIQAIDRVKNVVDGIYIAYPSEGGQCLYCNPRDLEKVLSHYRRPIR